MDHNARRRPTGPDGGPDIRTKAGPADVPGFEPKGDVLDGPDFKQRRARRHLVNEAAKLCPQSLYRIEVKVRDLSPFGFMAECAELVRIGSYVSIEVPGLGPVHAQVRWQIGVRMGGMFLDPISLARCDWAAVKADTPFSPEAREPAKP